MGLGHLGDGDGRPPRRAAPAARDRRARGILSPSSSGLGHDGRRSALQQHLPLHRDLHRRRLGPKPAARDHRARRDRARHVRVAVLGAHLLYKSAVQDYLPDLPREGTLSPYVAVPDSSTCSRTCCTSAVRGTSATAPTARRARGQSFEQRTAELAAERERTRAQAVAIERLRIARELHDVVAHHVSVIGVQAGAARRVLAKDPDAASASLSAIEASARDAVDELHRLLGTLRGTSDTGEVEVSPALASIDEPPDHEHLDARHRPHRRARRRIDGERGADDPRDRRLPGSPCRRSSDSAPTASCKRR